MENKNIVVAVAAVLAVVIAAAALLLPGDGKKPGGAPATPAASRDARAQATAAARKGVEYLKTIQNPDGSYGSAKMGPAFVLGMTALVVDAATGSPDGARLKGEPVIKKAVEYILSKRRPEGSISDGDMIENYTTSVSIMALAALADPAYQETILKAREYVLGIQAGPEKGKLHEGGIGYGSKPQPDLSNTTMALEALKASGLPPEDPAFQRALKFVSRLQNNTETNDAADTLQEQGLKIGDDGGFFYKGDESKAGKDEEAKTLRSYGSMTYAGLMAMIYCGLDEKDPRVKSAYEWCMKHYTFDGNPGMTKEAEGHVYYLLTMSKALRACGKRELATPDGKKHDWAADLAGKIASMQKPDGSWMNEKSDRWAEADTALATSYCLIALSNCLEVMGK